MNLTFYFPHTERDEHSLDMYEIHLKEVGVTFKLEYIATMGGSVY
jgi:hypothetical protein